jgi:hypothetical protein
MLSDYNMAVGGFMLLGLQFILFAQASAAKASGFGQHSIASHDKGYPS